MDWSEQLVLAAARRARVKLASGAIGVIVYAPGTETSRGRKTAARHGDRAQCGVRLGAASGKVTAVPTEEIIEILGEVRPDGE